MEHIPCALFKCAVNATPSDFGVNYVRSDQSHNCGTHTYRNVLIGNGIYDHSMRQETFSTSQVSYIQQPSF